MNGGRLCQQPVAAFTHTWGVMTDQQYAELLNQHMRILDKMSSILGSLQTIETILVIFAFLQLIGMMAIIGLASWSVSRTVGQLVRHIDASAENNNKAREDMKAGLSLIAQTVRGRLDVGGTD
jgi:class 3 adenylate cyclase